EPRRRRDLPPLRRRVRLAPDSRRRGARALAARGKAVKAFRAEGFGGIVQLERPRALVFVDRDYARSLGHDGGACWAEGATDGQIGARPLAAPLEAHLQLTNRCDAGCQGCYTGATPTRAAPPSPPAPST